MLHVITAYETLAAFECERVIIDLPAFVHERVTIGQPLLTGVRTRTRDGAPQ